MTQQFHSYLYTLKKLTNRYLLAVQKHYSSSPFCKDPIPETLLFIGQDLQSKTLKKSKNVISMKARTVVTSTLKVVMRKGHVETGRCFWSSRVLFLNLGGKFFLYMIQLSCTFKYFKPFSVYVYVFHSKMDSYIYKIQYRLHNKLEFIYRNK